MTDVTRIVETQFKISGQATKNLDRLARGAVKLNGLFDKVSTKMGKLGGLAAAAFGGLSVGAAIYGAQRYLETVRDISTATGFAASNVDAVLEAMDRANISAGEGSQIIQKMSISMQRYRMEVDRTGKAQSDASRIIERLGISLKQGPQAAMVQMAAAAKRGELSMADLNIAFQVSETSAVRLQSLLKRGPEEVGRIMRELQDQGLAVNAQSMMAFNRYEEAVIRIKSAWNRIAIVVSSKVMPVVANLLEGVRDKLEGWTAHAAKWGKMVGEFLKNHLRTVIRIGKVLAANALLIKVSGSGIGGWVARLPELGRWLSKATTVAKAVGPAAVAAQMAAGMGAMRIGGAVAGAPPVGAAVGAAQISGAFTAAAPAATKTIFTTLAAAAKPLALAMGVVAAAMAIVVPGVIAIKDNFMGVRTTILDLWDRIMGRLDEMGMNLEPIIGPVSKLFTREGPVGHFFMTLLPNVIIAYMRYTDFFLQIVQTIGRYFSTILSPVADYLRAKWDVFIATIKGTPAALRKIGDGFKDYVFKPILVGMASVFKWLMSLFEKLPAPIQKIFQWHAEAAGLAGRVASGIGKAVAGEAGRVAKVGKAATGIGLLEKPIKLFATLWKEVSAEADAAAMARRRVQAEERTERRGGGRRPPPGIRQPAPVYDFRGSTFDITQQFAQGFDPGRIAVAFTNDLATLGERKLQSSLSPLGAIR